MIVMIINMVMEMIMMKIVIVIMMVIEVIVMKMMIIDELDLSMQNDSVFYIVELRAAEKML